MEDVINSLKLTVSKARNYDGIDVITAGNILKNNLTTLSADVKTAAQNIKNYTAGLTTLDTDDFTTQANFFSLSNIKDNIGNFFTSIFPNYITTKVNNLKTDTTNLVQDVTDVVTNPVTIVDETTEINNQSPEPTEITTSNQEQPTDISYTA